MVCVLCMADSLKLRGLALRKAGETEALVCSWVSLYDCSSSREVSRHPLLCQIRRQTNGHLEVENLLSGPGVKRTTRIRVEKFNQMSDRFSSLHPIHRALWTRKASIGGLPSREALFLWFKLSGKSPASKLWPSKSPQIYGGLLQKPKGRRVVALKNSAIFCNIIDQNSIIHDVYESRIIMKIRWHTMPKVGQRRANLFSQMFPWIINVQTVYSYINNSNVTSLPLSKLYISPSIY